MDGGTLFPLKPLFGKSVITSLARIGGEVVGIVASLLNPTREDVFIGIGFAIPIDDTGGAIGLPPV